VALTVLDEECSVWLGGQLGENAEVAAWLAFHTGVRVVSDPAEADVIFTHPAVRPPWGMLRSGSEEAPHRSATVVLDIRGLGGSLRFTARGPGIDGDTDLDAPWADDDFGTEWDLNTAHFPRGVDLLLVDEDTVAALPRTTRLTATDSKKEA
jgi:alpha-D-ribose 1-methylphosphonate 5-triphosphate synthase subunit PhnH